MLEKKHPQKQARQTSKPNAEPIGPEMASIPGAASQMPPQIQLKTSGNAAAASEVAQFGTTNVTLPERLGARQEGPISARGAGDANAFSPNDINQGSIGDCFFLASLAAVAHTNPDLIRRAITQNSDGTFTVRLFVERERRVLFWRTRNLVPVNVKLYPTFPISVAGTDTANPEAGTNPAHAHGGDTDARGRTELWVRLVEKAYALLMGSYAAIGNGGFAADALETLTGERFTERVLDDDSKERIIEMVEDGIPVTVSTNTDKFRNLSAEDRRFANENSIVGGHAYSVVSADNSRIRIRNPWGTGARNPTPEITWTQFQTYFNQFSDQD